MLPAWRLPIQETTSFNGWVKQRRHALDLTQKEIARQIGCAVSTIEKIEQGVLRPSRQIAALLAERLELAPDERPAFVQWARTAPTSARSPDTGASAVFPMPGNAALPIPPTPLIGREQDLTRLRTLLLRGESRLVTLTGAPGSGKTRLALHLAGDLLGGYSDGVWFVELSAVTEPEMVIPTIAQAQGVKEGVGAAAPTLIDTLKAYLREKHQLLVLDNFEQVSSAAGEISHLLAAAPRLAVLCTSRMPLRIRGEKVYAVSPLELPPTRHLPPLEALIQYEAVRLFVARATDAKTDFQVTHENARSVAEICVQLDGLPLAIELAAARVKMCSPASLLSRLDQRLKLLTGGPRDLPARQQTLRGAIDWSYDLLDDGHKQLFRRLAPFLGGRTLEGGEAVCNYDGELQIDVFEGAQALLTSSLLQQREGRDGEPRLWMLETIHEYAREKLAESGEGEAVSRAHALYFMRLVEEAEPHLHGPQQVEWLDRLEVEHNNIRAALQWCLREDSKVEDIDTALRTVGALRMFWGIRGYVREGRSRAEAVLRHPAAERASAGRARALMTASRLCWFQRNQAAARLYAGESLAICRKLGDRWGIILALEVLGAVTLDQGDAETSMALLGECLALRKEIGYTQGITGLLAVLASAALGRREYTNAMALIEEHMPLVKALGDKRGTAILLHTSAYVLRGLGDYKGCLEHFSNSLALTEEVGDRQFTGWNLMGLAEVAAEKREPLRAAQLFGAAESLLQTLGIPLTEHPVDRELCLRTVAATHDMLGASNFEQAWQEGRAMNMEEAVAYALDEVVLV